MKTIWPYLWVFLGAGIGGALRHGANKAGLALVGQGFPAGTLFVNIVGCLVMGLLTSFFALRGEATNQATRLLLTTGVLGGFTTFSTFSLDTAVLWQRGHDAVTASYVIGSVGGSIAAVFIGLALGRALFA